MKFLVFRKIIKLTLIRINLNLVQTSDEYNSALEKIIDLAMENNHSLNSARLTIDSVYVC